MSFKLNKSDYKSLECIAEYRMLTVTQIAAIFHKSRQVVRRRLCDGLNRQAQQARHNHLRFAYGAASARLRPAS
jgi:hypothetical protein